MSGQSAALTLKEACAMQERVQASGSQAACGSGGGKKSMSSAPKETHRKMKHEDKKMEKE
jgi:hypothetical protein